MDRKGLFFLKKDHMVLEPFAKLETLSTRGGTKLCLDIASSMALAIEFGNIKASSGAGTS